MKQIVAGFLFSLLPAVAFAQQPTAPAPTSQNPTEVENQYLVQEVAQAIQQYTKAAAMLTTERNSATKLQAELAYWREWCGPKPGCVK